jgi:hypothetical protein
MVVDSQLKDAREDAEGAKNNGSRTARREIGDPCLYLGPLD